MARHDSELTDEQWNKIEPLLPKLKPSPKGGRKRIGDRRCFEGILWVLRSGARWKDLPSGTPRRARAGVGYATGKTPTSGLRSGVRS